MGNRGMRTVSDASSADGDVRNYPALDSHPQ
jgi:hypothetical protein